MSRDQKRYTPDSDQVSTALEKSPARSTWKLLNAMGNLLDPDAYGEQLENEEH